ncbi:unnamed protein product [Tenebrio molitor]|nr:unnamed protein product [Tenebrio molitor]
MKNNCIFKGDWMDKTMYRRFYRILLVRSDHYHNLFSEIRKGKIIRNVSNPLALVPKKTKFKTFEFIPFIFKITKAYVRVRSDD